MNPEVAEETTTPPANHDSDFQWAKFLDAVHQDHEGLFQQLKKTQYYFSDNTLHLYPTMKFTKKFLDRPNSKQNLLKYLDGASISIHELGETKPGEDPTISQISAIMGGVQEAGEEAPFE